jgi:16S rRNA (guanine966-N2)-methyltransferase
VRIIAGKMRGSKIEAPPAGTRPTPDKVREAVFAILQPRIFGTRVLDVFAGSGAMGLEAISRGAEQAVFIDNSRRAAPIIKGNIEKLKVEGQSRLIIADFKRALAALSGAEAFDIAFLDPPFDEGLMDQAIEQLFSLNLIAQDGIICAEHRHGTSIAKGFEVYDARRYGAVAISFIRKGSAQI